MGVARFHVSLDGETYERLGRLAERLGVSRAAALRMLVHAVSVEDDGEEAVVYVVGFPTRRVEVVPAREYKRMLSELEWLRRERERLLEELRRARGRRRRA